MKTTIFILVFFPIIALSQSKDSIIVYQGNGSFEKIIIDLSNKNFSEIPIIDFQVEVLILDNNSISELPNWIANLKNLRSLSVRNNKLEDVDILMYCENLEELYLTGNINLCDLPSFSIVKN